MSYLKVKDRKDLIRNSRTGCIVNTNVSQYNEYIARRDSKQNESESVRKDLDDLKSEMNEIKSLLKELVNGN